MREGGYDVRGKKNFLPPAMLVLGYGVLWTTEDEETMERHARPLLEIFATEVPQDNPEEEIEVDDEGGIDDKPNESEDKYNLDQYGSASEEEEVVQEPESAQTSTKRHLTTKQRRDLKKGKPIEDDSEESDVDQGSSSTNTMTLSKPKSAPKVRGKKGKKKIKARYTDQSDDERELAQKLLGAKPTTAEKSAEEVPPADKVEVPPPVKKAPPQIPRPPKPVVDEPLEVLFPSHISNFRASIFH
jgi:hypothetical protein